MPDDSSTPSQPGGERPDKPEHQYGGSDRYEALLRVMEQEAEKVRQEGAFGAATPGEGRVRLVVLAVLVIAFGIVSWRGKEWLGPQPIPTQTVAESEQSLRVGMYLQAQRIKAYRLENGRYPRELEEAGDPLPRLEYRLLDDGTYELVGENNGVIITYRSDRPLGDFLGDAESVLRLGTGA